MMCPPYHIKCEQSHVALSAESQETLRTVPAHNPFEDTQSPGYYHYSSQRHQAISGGYYPSKCYQHQFGPSHVAHSRPNGFYHP
jgi:hypothetical protein